MKIIATGWAFPDADEFMVGQMKADGTYQAGHCAAALGYVTDWRVAIDGGAHVGTWTRLLAQKFDTVIAVEPCADTFEALTANLQTFGCANVTTKRIALGASAGRVSIAPLEPRAQALANTGARFVRMGGDIPMESIDSWALPALGFLKLDVEGSEYAALMGARETITRCKPIVLFENKNLWRRFGVPPDGPHQLLKGLGYRFLVKMSCDEIYGPADAR